jgi:Na+-driven multidrug efflux pump
MFVLSASAFLWAEYIVRIFDTEPELVVLASSFIRVAAAGYLVMGLTAILQQCLNGVGDTLIPMVIMLLNMWLVQVPLAFFLPRVTSLGVYGVRWAIVAGSVAGTVVYVAYFRLGRWKHKRV